MPYCQHCGTEVTGNFCSHCGTQVGAAAPATPRFIIHENAVVKPRYSTLSLIIAGYLGFTTLLASILAVVGGIYIYTATPDITFENVLSMLIALLISFAMAYLFYLPGIHSIRKYSPKGMARDAFKSFFWKSVGFVFLWGVSFAGCVYLVGIPLKVWRLGLWTSRPNDDHYTAIVDGKKIPVVRYFDDLPCRGKRGKWVYQDEKGEFYRPPVK